MAKFTKNRNKGAWTGKVSINNIKIKIKELL